MDWRQDLRARCVQSLLNTSDVPGDDASDPEDDDDEDVWMDIPSEEITSIRGSRKVGQIASILSLQTCYPSHRL